MSDCDAGDSTQDYSCAPDTSTDYCSSYTEPARDYETCVPDRETESSNHHSETTDTDRHCHHSHPNSEDGSAEGSALDRIDDNAIMTDVLYDTALTDGILHATPETEHHHYRHVPRFSRYNPRPSYKPSYIMNRRITRQSPQYADGTHVLNRIQNKIENPYSSQPLWRRVLLVIAAMIVFCAIVASICIYFRLPHKHNSNGETQEKMFSVPDFSETNENTLTKAR